MAKTKLRTFHLWDLPKKKIRVLLESGLRNKIINQAVKIAGSQCDLADALQEKYDIKITQKKTSNYKIGKYFMPLHFLTCMIDFLNVNNVDINLFEIEKKVVAFRGPRGSAIYNPNFPWKEDVKIVRILFHIIGDGHAGGEISKGRVPVYVNSDKNLIDEFREDLKFFGEVSTREYKDITTKAGSIYYKLELPKVIGHIIRHSYKIKTGCKNVRIPDTAFSLPKHIICDGVRAFADDEGSQKGTEIHFYSSNKPLLEDVNKLIKTRMPELKTVTEVRVNAEKKTGNIYYFAILADDLKTYKRLIGFKHKDKKRKLNFQLKCQNRHFNNRGPYKTKLLILKSLENGDKISYGIAEDTLVTHRTINKHINGYTDDGIYFKGLKEIGTVTSIEKIKDGIVWSITENGKSILMDSKSFPTLRN